VLLRGEADLSSGTVYAQLQDDYGSQTEANAAVEHFRVIYAAEDDRRFVYAVVPGATVTGTAEPGTTVTAETTLTVPPANESVSYTQEVQVGSSGRYEFTTPYPGRYTVGDDTVTVAEEAVTEGQTVGNGTTADS